MSVLHVVTIDLEKNRMYLLLKGSMKDSEVEEAANKVKEGADRLKPGFDVVNDISEFNPITQNGREIVKNAQIYLFQKHVGRVVRIVGYAVAKAQFEVSSKKAGYIAISVRSLDEAYDVLEGRIILAE